MTAGGHHRTSGLLDLPLPVPCRNAAATSKTGDGQDANPPAATSPGGTFAGPGKTVPSSFIIVERHVDTANEQPQRLGNHPIRRIHFPQRDCRLARTDPRVAPTFPIVVVDEPFDGLDGGLANR